MSVLIDEHRDRVRRPIWLLPPVKPVLDAHKLPQDARTDEARQSAAAVPPSAFEFAARVDWCPAEAWGPLVAG